jgi:hypothetical protein
MTAPVALASLDRLFAHAERATALLDRCRPVSASAEIARVTALWERGEAASPVFRYLPRPELTPLLRALEAVAELGEAGGAWPALYGGRALELHREASIVDALETPAFGARAAARFPVDGSEFGVQASERAAAWLTEEPDEGPVLIAADDAHDPRSLLSCVQALVGELRLPVRVTTSHELASAAATGDGFIVVREGLRHPVERARRIALHEVFGHALPRVRARNEAVGLFAAGTAQGADDEEGRSLLIEERHGLMDAGRRYELAVRHVAAQAARAGADFADTMRLLVGRGVSPKRAVSVCARVHRGGGLAREIVYLPAFHRVQKAFAQEPALESWLERGRVSVAAARTLRAIDVPPPYFSGRTKVLAEDATEA